MTNDLSLAGFLTSLSARGRITFGDVRRLQRDYLPGGIESRAQAELLMALAAEIEHADRSFGHWFAAALADLSAKSAEGSATALDETIAWLEHLSGMAGFARGIPRKIVRQLRRGAEPADPTARAAEDASVDAVMSQEPAVTADAQRDGSDETERRRRTRAAKRSRIIVRRRSAKRSLPLPERGAMPFAIMQTPWVWSSLMGERQLQIQLATPVR